MIVDPQSLRVLGARTNLSEARTAALQRWAWVGLVVLCVAFYIRTFGYGLYLDDYWLVRPWSGHEVAHAFVSRFDPSGLNPEYFRPLAGVSFAADWAVWGSTTWGSHLTNLILHIAAVLLVHRLLLRLGLRWWAAFAGAAYFAIVPSNAATVVYVAERTDAMAAICIVLGLLCVREYHQTRRTTWLVALGVAFVFALLSKEIGLALAPMAVVWWWYLRVESRSQQELPARGEPEGVRSHWMNEARRWWRALTEPAGRLGWLAVVGPLAAISLVYLVYRSAVLAADSLGDRFGESQNPVRALIGGIDSTVKGVPWELRGWTLVPLLILFGGAFLLAPRARAWRVVVLGAWLIVAGIAPLLFSGGVEPRLLYVAEIGMAVAVAGVLSVVGDIVARARADGRRERPILAGAFAAVLLVVAVSGVSSIRAQDQFAEGSAKKLVADVTVYHDPRAVPYVVPERLAELRRRLLAAGLITP